ncbi:hypothetical protein WKH50_21285 [Pantoea agglomerans]|uniref:hypothetical protein n=1 Tax=Enterobacter agglomerans TaxID=549 RepID=UPI003C7B6A89
MNIDGWQVVHAIILVLLLALAGFACVRCVRHLRQRVTALRVLALLLYGGFAAFLVYQGAVAQLLPLAASIAACGFALMAAYYAWLTGQH